MFLGIIRLSIPTMAIIQHCPFFDLEKTQTSIGVLLFALDLQRIRFSVVFNEKKLLFNEICKWNKKCIDKTYWTIKENVEGSEKNYRLKIHVSNSIWIPGSMFELGLAFDIKSANNVLTTSPLNRNKSRKHASHGAS